MVEAEAWAAPQPAFLEPRISEEQERGSRWVVHQSSRDLGVEREHTYSDIEARL